MAKSKKKNKSSTNINWKKVSTIAAFALVIVAGITFGILAINRDKNKTNDAISDAERNPAIQNQDIKPGDNSGSIDDYTQGDDIKTQGDKEEESEKPLEKHENGKKKASVILNYAEYEQADEATSSDMQGHIIASGQVVNLVENNGSCVYDFTDPNGKHHKVTSKTLPNAKNIICASVELATDLEGEWKASLSYESETSMGISEIENFSVKK